MNGVTLAALLCIAGDSEAVANGKRWLNPGHTCAPCRQGESYRRRRARWEGRNRARRQSARRRRIAG